MLEVWTASHITNNEQCYIFQLTIDSILSQEEVNFYRISISGEYEISHKFFIELLNKYETEERIDIRYSMIKRSQFEHYQLIYNDVKEEEGFLLKRIMLMDDDDLLLRVPEEINNFEYKIIQGVQYLPPFLETNFFNYKEVIRDEINFNKDNDYSIVIDLSGYICYGLIMSEFFEIYSKEDNYQPGKLLSSLTDTLYMRVLDKYKTEENDKIEPFVYHRLWRNNNNKEWCLELRGQIKRMGDILKKF